METLKSEISGRNAKHPVVELQNVTVELGGTTILKDVTFKIFSGEVMVIIGPSGEGKSVLLKTMAGIYPPRTGHVLLLNHERGHLSHGAIHDLAKRIGMQFQKSALFDELTALENIAFVLREHTEMSEAEIDTRALECLRMVGLDQYRDFHEHELSGGMKQRLGIARSMALKPEILFLDDPTAGLDPVNADNMAEMILKLKNEIDATLIVVTNDMQRAYQFAGRIFLVANGSVIETGDAKRTKDSKDPAVRQFITGSRQGPLTNSRGFH